MKLVEKHIIKKTHPLYKELDQLAFRSKNLYNSALYTVRQEYFATEKYLNSYQIFKQFKGSSQPDYIALPRKVSMQVLFQVDRNYISFFNALKEYRADPSKFEAPPQIPKYKHKIKGRNLLTYDRQAISTRSLRQGLIHLSQTNIKIKTRIKDIATIKQVQVVPRINSYAVMVIYEVPDVLPHKDNGKIAAIDLGVNNLAALTFNTGDQPQIINGKPLKSINQYFNKKKATLQSQLKGNQETSNRIRSLTHKRNNKIADYMHKSSRYLVNQLVSKDITTLVIGYNPTWKQETNHGKCNNQNFVYIPYLTFIEMLQYKCELAGITVKQCTEEYTSKCSFLDLEEIGKHEEYAGKRVKRGLFKSASGKKLNADVNGSFNIMRKAVPNVFDNGIEDVAVHPIGLINL